MLKITCFGGVGEIGGNKILVEDSGSALMLDFGKSFSGAGDYFDEFLQPRANSCLRDLLTLNILPRIPGIYRHDLLNHTGVWKELSDDIPDSARRLYECDLKSYDEYTAKYGKKLDGILISHSHTDHYQYLSFVDPKIPVYCTETTWAILKAAEDIGRGNYEADIIESPSRTHTKTTKSSTFPDVLKIDKDKTTCSRNIIVVENSRPFKVGGFEVEAIPVDHSVPGACSFIITSPSGKKLFYTGDIRFHGRFSLPPYSMTEDLRARTKGLKPDVILTEGTRIGSDGGDNELGVEKGIREVIDGCSGLAIVDFGWKDTTRFQTILNATKACGRVLAVSPKVAYLWAILRETDPDNFADLDQDENVKVYFRRVGSMTYSLADYSSFKYLAGTNADWGEKNQDMKVAFEARNSGYLNTRLSHYFNGVRAYDIKSNPQKYVLHAGYFEMNELFDVSPPEGSVFIRAATEPFSDDMVQDEKKLSNWLRHFGINEGQHEKIIRHHVSGHASGPDLLQFISDMKPDLVIPIHTEQPEIFERELKGSANVHIPRLEEEIIII